MKIPFFIFLSFSIFLGGCQIDNGENGYSSESETIPFTRVNLRKDVAEHRVCDWGEAHSLEEKYLALINYLRAQPINCGDVHGPTTCLTWNTNLFSAAKEHSNDMAANNFVAPSGSFKSSDITAYDLGLSKGSTPAERASNNDFDGSGIAENEIKTVSLTGTITDDDIIQGVERLMHSKNGCSYLMNGYADAVGMAQSTREINGKTYIYWTQIFGQLNH